ncbi:MAG: isochorismate synthase [Planctomycetota bacterium]|nr:isochorismate synthase [Planctomycetota bacterium]MDA1106246.1 isochorismate synthase [Planctomycetota bacterium]
MSVVHVQARRVVWLPQKHNIQSAAECLADWARTLPPGGAAHARVPLPPVDPMEWLQSQDASAGRWLYQTRSTDAVPFAIGGLGEAATACDLNDPKVEPFLVMSDRTAWCTGPIAYSWRPFASRTDAAAWGGLSEPRVIIPRVDVRRDADGCSMGLSIAGGTDAERTLSVELLEDLGAPCGSSWSGQLEMVGDDNPAHWADMVELALQRIESGTLEKVVLARTRTLRAMHSAGVADVSIDPFAVAERLGMEEPASAVAVLQPAEGPAFVMVSPERLYRRRDRIIESHAVAGTCGRGPDAESDAQLAGRLLRSDKNRREHDLTLRYIESVLEPLTTERSWQREPRILRLTHVQHLMTELRGALREGVDDEAILAALHPTPAVCGVPTTLAREFIHAHESAPRGLYSGVVGVSCDAAAEFSVGIRSALVVGNTVTAYAGAGIVDGSDADAEWLETARKLETFDSLTRGPRADW